VVLCPLCKLESSVEGDKRIGNLHLKWTFSGAAVGFLRTNEEGKELYNRLVQKHGKGQALPARAHKLARAVNHIWTHDTVSGQERFLMH